MVEYELITGKKVEEIGEETVAVYEGGQMKTLENGFAAKDGGPIPMAHWKQHFGIKD